MTGYSYSGTTPEGMSLSGSSPLTLSGRPASNGAALQVSRGEITASVSSGPPLPPLACVLRVREETTTTTTTDPRPVQEPGWSGACYEKLRLGGEYGNRTYPELPLPWYGGADEVRYSGRKPRGILTTRIEGEAYLYGTANEAGIFEGRITAWSGRSRLSTQDCVIFVKEGTWQPDLCEFFLEVGRVYDITMPRLAGVPVDGCYSSGSFPPGLTVENHRVRGSPAIEGTWSPRWTARIGGVTTHPSITCTFHVEQTTPAGWSEGCNWTFTVGHSYTRILPVATGATIHTWTGDKPTGMRMRFRNSGGVWAQELSGTPTEEGLWEGVLSPYPASDTEDIECSFEVLPGPTPSVCSRTIPSDQIRQAVKWRTDVPKTDPHIGVPGGDSYLITTGDPGVGGEAPASGPGGRPTTT